MALNITALFDAATSHASASGHFEQVNGHEAVNPSPTGGLTAAVWVNQITAIRSSGLDSTSALVVLNVRIYTSATSLPLDAIDPAVTAAVDALCAAYVGDFTFDGLIRSVDVLGAHGQALDVRAGYIQQDGALTRVMTIWLPCVVNDLWEEVA